MISINPVLIEQQDYQLSLADRDKYLQQIEQQIAAKRKMLIDKRNYLERTLKENAFLEGVKKDYQKYRDYVVKEKHWKEFNQ